MGNVLTGSWDNTARLWDIQRGQEVRRFEGKVTTVHDIALSNDNELLLTGSGDGNTRLWDLKTGKKVPRDLPGIRQQSTLWLFHQTIRT